PGLCRALRSFPTRRSSDLIPAGVAAVVGAEVLPVGEVLVIDHAVGVTVAGAGRFGSEQLLERELQRFVVLLLFAVHRLMTVAQQDRKSTRLNSSHVKISYA